MSLGKLITKMKHLILIKAIQQNLYEQQKLKKYKGMFSLYKADPMYDELWLYAKEEYLERQYNKLWYKYKRRVWNLEPSVLPALPEWLSEGYSNQWYNWGYFNEVRHGTAINGLRVVFRRDCNFWWTREGGRSKARLSEPYLHKYIGYGPVV